jgi:phage regulator Rha-like protein
MQDLIPIQIIENKIFVIRGQKVMLDSDLALLYETETFRLNEAVKRHLERFPSNFMFQLTKEEWKFLTSQFAMSKAGRGGRRTLPYVFTEHGVLMIANVLNSQKAIAVSIQIINAFVKLREMALTHKDLSQRLDEMEKSFINYTKENNIDIQEIFNQLKYLTELNQPKQTEQIGFKTWE